MWTIYFKYLYFSHLRHPYLLLSHMLYLLQLNYTKPNLYYQFIWKLTILIAFEFVNNIFFYHSFSVLLVIRLVIRNIVNLNIDNMWVFVWSVAWCIILLLLFIIFVVVLLEFLAMDEHFLKQFWNGPTSRNQLFNLIFKRRTVYCSHKLEVLRHDR